MNINAARGLACVLLVGYHAVGLAQPGAHPIDHPLQYLMASFGWIRMPLFSALGGYLFMRHTPNRANVTEFAAKKLRRLGAPYLAVLLLFAAYLETAEGYGSAVVHGLFTGYHHLWFLLALGWIFAFYAFWFVQRTPRTRELVATILAAAVLARVIQTEWLAFGGALYLLPYFTMGMLVARHPGLVIGRTAVAALAVLAATLVVQQLGLWHLIGERGSRSPVAVLGSLAAILGVLRWMPRSGPLEWIGGYSYTIYLWHYLVIDVTRNALAGASEPAPFLVATGAGLLVPVAIHLAARRVPVASLLFTGNRAMPYRRIYATS